MITADWSTKILTVPVSDLTVVSSGRYKITAREWWNLLQELTYTDDGIVKTMLSKGDFPYSNTRPTDVTPRVINLINGYTVYFADGPYSVDVTEGNTNLGFSGIHEISDGVSVNTNNTVGYSTVATGSGVTPEDKSDIINGVWEYTGA